MEKQFGYSLSVLIIKSISIRLVRTYDDFLKSLLLNKKRYSYLNDVRQWMQLYSELIFCFRFLTRQELLAVLVEKVVISTV